MPENGNPHPIDDGKESWLTAERNCTCIEVLDVKGCKTRNNNNRQGKVVVYKKRTVSVYGNVTWLHQESQQMIGRKISVLFPDIRG